VGNVTLNKRTFTVNMTLTTNQTSYYRGSGIKILGRLMNVTGNNPIANATNSARSSGSISLLCY
jgi:hypothetical protein